MFKFEHKSHDNTKVTLETEAVCLSDILEEFGMFLRGCGFHFNGDIVIEDPEEYIEPIASNDYLDEIDKDSVELVKELNHEEQS